jgi:hypothetical protein
MGYRTATRNTPMARQPTQIDHRTQVFNKQNIHSPHRTHELAAEHTTGERSHTGADAYSCEDCVAPPRAGGLRRCVQDIGRALPLGR